MWLTLLWQNKGLVAMVALIAAFAGLAGALKIQTMRLDSAKADLEETTQARDVAIAAHDALANDYAKQKELLARREAVGAQQEKDHAQLVAKIDDILRGHRAWRGAAVPSDLDRMLRDLPTLPENPRRDPAQSPDRAPAAGVPRAGQ